MSAPFTPGVVGNSQSAGVGPQTTTATWEFDATEADRVLVMASGAALAAAEVINIYTRHPDGTGAIGGGPAGTVPVYTDAGAARQLTATVQSMFLEGGVIYVFVKSVTVAAVGCAVAVKRGQSS
jgi:hypothetical protein